MTRDKKLLLSERSKESRQIETGAGPADRTWLYLDWPKEEMVYGMGSGENSGLRPVSYTHLDVYKRQILEDEEQADILEEYTQHIDMKISTGLSEAEAIRDFGNVSELAAQILEAYHVPGAPTAHPRRRHWPSWQ